MSVSLYVLILALCVLSINGRSSQSRTTYTNTSSSSPNANSTSNSKDNITELFNLLLQGARSHSAISMFVKGFDLNETEQKKFKIWPQGDIPYYIDMLSFDFEQENKIADIFEKYNKLTGLNFYRVEDVPEMDGDRWILFANRKGFAPCLQYTVDNFTDDGMQRVLLGWDCITAGVGFGPLVLALAGVPPQHNSPDRDEYIEIIWDNIAPMRRPLFTKLNDSDWLFHSVKYDFSSAGHFSNNIYSLNGNITFRVIKEMDSLDLKFGVNLGLSNLDIKKIKMLYNYVSRNRTNPRNETRRSNNYDIDDGLPRAKPNRYLGLPDPTTTTITTSIITTTIPPETSKTINFRKRRNRRRRRYERMRSEVANNLLMLLV